MIFFRRYLHHLLHRAPLPQQQVEFTAQLRQDLFGESSIRSGLVPLTTTMKRHKLLTSALVMGLGFGAVLLAWQLAPTKEHFGSTAEALAASIEHTFTFQNDGDFQHYRIVQTDQQDNTITTAESWYDPNNVRLDINSDDEGQISFLISQADQVFCMSPDISTNHPVECYTQGSAEVNQAPINRSPINLTPTQVELHADDGLLTWTLPNSIANWDISFSFDESGYADGGTSSVAASTLADGSVQYSVSLPTNDPLLVQLCTGDHQNCSSVYQLDRETNTVSALSDADVTTLQKSYATRIRDRALQSTDAIYQITFAPVLALQQQLQSNTIQPISETTDQLDGETVKHVRYTVADIKTDQPWPDHADTVELVFSPDDTIVTEYTVFDRDHNIVQHTKVETAEVVTDLKPDQFFTLERWEKDLSISPDRINRLN